MRDQDVYDIPGHFKDKHAHQFFPDGIAGLTEDEIEQIGNIDDATISHEQWEYVGDQDQGTSSSDMPSFSGLTVSGEIHGYDIKPVTGESYNIGATNREYNSGYFKFVRAANTQGIGVFDDEGLGMFIKDGGKAGFGTTDPGEVVDVVGNIAVSGTVDGVHVSIFQNLTTAEIAQLENINTKTIGNSQWGYLEAMDQGVSQSDSPVFNAPIFAALTVTGAGSQTIVSDLRIGPDNAGEAQAVLTKTTGSNARIRFFINALEKASIGIHDSRPDELLIRDINSLAVDGHVKPYSGGTLLGTTTEYWEAIHAKNLILTSTGTIISTIQTGPSGDLVVEPVSKRTGYGVTLPQRPVEIGTTEEPQIRLTNTVTDDVYTDIKTNVSGDLIIEPISKKASFGVTAPQASIDVGATASPQLRLTNTITDDLYTDIRTNPSGDISIEPSSKKAGVNTTEPQAGLHVSTTGITPLRISNTVTGIYTDFKVVETEVTGALLIEPAAGRTGFGVTAPQRPVEVGATSGPQFRITNTITDDVYIDFRVNDSGDLIVGDTGKAAFGGVTAPIAIVEVGATDGNQIRIVNTVTDGLYADVRVNETGNLYISPHLSTTIIEKQFSLPDQSAVSVYLGTNQAISSGSTAKVEFDTEDYDTLGEYDPTTNYRFTAMNAGKYMITTQVSFQVTAADDRLMVEIDKNGSEIAEAYAVAAAATENHSICISKIASLSAGDYIEVKARNNDNNDTIDAGTSETYLTIQRIA